jgi:hypothetical protein
MFQFKADFNDLYSGNRSVEFSRLLNPELVALNRRRHSHRNQKNSRKAANKHPCTRGLAFSSTSIGEPSPTSRCAVVARAVLS